MTRPIRLLALAALCLFACASARAEKWALLIGINHYEDANNIASLGAADNDARELKKALKSQLGFPEANITLLVSDGDTKPTRSNIVEALGNLSQNAVAGDTVFVFYSGHGVELQNKSCLLPYDFRGKIAFTGIETALEVSKFNDQLKQIKAKALIMVWDMCRNDPFSKGKGAETKRNVLKNPKGWGIVAADTRARGNDAPVVANFFACSSGETSFEWTDKNRGYFAYFLEKGIKGEAADAEGNITLGSLAKYVQKNVPTVTKNNEGQAQTPYPEFGGAGASEFVLATGKVNPNADVPPTGNSLSGGTVKSVSTRSTLLFAGQPAGAKILVEKLAVKGASWAIDLLEATKEVTVTITAEGYRPRLFSVTLERGKSTAVDAALEKIESEKTPDPMPDPESNAGKVPPPAGNNASGPLGEVLNRIREAHKAGALATMRPFKFVGTAAGEVLGGSAKTSFESLVVIQAPNSSYRIEYIDTSEKKKVVAGFDGQRYWKNTGGRPDQVKQTNPFSDNPIGALFYVLTTNSLEFDRFSKPSDKSPYLSGKDKYLSDFKIFYDPKSFIITEIDSKQSGVKSSWKFSEYRNIGAISLPQQVLLESFAFVKLGEFLYKFDRIEPNAPFSGSYFSGN